MSNKLLYSIHAKERMEERNIKSSWIELTLENYNDFQEVQTDKHYFLKTIPENKNRCLKIIFNPLTNTVISVHFDRGLKKKGCQFD